jgi:SAM-dependent methyltransferase
MNATPEPNDPGYWQLRYESGETGWDAGAVTEPLRKYFEGLSDNNSRILIPGAGNAWEARWLHQHGFRNVVVLDIAKSPLENFAKKNPDFPSDHLIHGDFFSHAGTYDLIVEQTFFCAIDPSMRSKYAETVHRLLKPGGLLAGVLFDFEFEGGPPFGGTREEYRDYFADKFRFLTFEPCYNSIEPRAGRELFVRLEKIA